jgi:hypothetical protein
VYGVPYETRSVTDLIYSKIFILPVILIYLRPEVVTTVKNSVMAFRAVAPCGTADGYQRCQRSPIASVCILRF